MFEHLPDAYLLAWLLWGEARGEPLQAKIAVGCVVRNRVKNPGWWGKTWKEVMLKPKQFSCFNHDDPNREKIVWAILEGLVPIQELGIAIAIMYDLLPDITDGATHYHDIGVIPYWAASMEKTAVIGNFIFYKEK